MHDDPLLSRIDQARTDLIGLAQDLIRIPTLNPPGRNYRAICDYLAARMLAQGWSVELIRATGAPGDSDAFPRWNMVARLESGRAGDCVHFNSHHDVVEVGHGWTRDPFGGELDGDRIYGRGACDMKGGLAASLIAAEPKPDPRRRRADLAIRGEVPSVLRRPAGCEFHTRCPLVRDLCRSTPPDLVPVGDGRQARCHFADQRQDKQGERHAVDHR